MIKLTTKKVWYDDQLWTVREHIAPNQWDDFLVLERKADGTIHADGKTVPVEIVCVDCHNENFYPDTPSVHRLMVNRAKKQAKLRVGEQIENKRLSDIWLSVFRDAGE